MESQSIQDSPPDKKRARVRNRRVHFANERTFLAWIRTSIGIMAFGFVVEKFALFVKQISYFLQKSGLPEGRHILGGGELPPSSRGYSAIFGIFLVALGALMAFLAFIRYKKVEKQIDEDSYEPSIILDFLLALSVLVIGILLIIYLVHSI
jgi:putative membrane protein